MAAQKGREFILEIQIDGSYQVVGGFRSNTFSINGETVDVTSKASGGFRELMEGAGIVSISTSGSGVFVSDTVFETVHNAMLNQTHLNGRITVPGFKSYAGNYAVSQLEMSGEHNGEVTYSIGLESSGTIDPQPASV